MNHKRFVLSALALTLVIFLSYFLTINAYLSRSDQIPSLWRQALLYFLSDVDNKIIIAAGSNSLHGIDTLQIEKHFNRPTINLSSNGSFPLSNKLYGIDAHTKSGDILVLPLEWTQYFYPHQYPEVYFEEMVSLGATVSFEYVNMPIRERVNFQFSKLPLQYGLTAIVNYLYSPSATPIHWSLANLNYNDTRLRGGVLINETESIPYQVSEEQSCDRYILGGENSHEITPQFHHLLDQLKALKTKGLDIYFTYPTVVDQFGNNCYKSGYSSFLEKRNEEIRSLVANAGLKFIGDYGRTAYAKDCFLNTYFHIKPECVATNTSYLIEQLELAGVAPSATEDVTHKTNKTLKDMINSHYIDNIKVLTRREVKAKEFSQFLLLKDGWSNLESDRVWSEGTTSSFDIHVPEKNTDYELTLKGIYFRGEEVTEVWINNQKIGKFNLTNATLKIDKELVSTTMMNIRLVHLSPTSPSILGISDDGRMLNFALTGISLAR
jgi:hypothetical protein